MSTATREVINISMPAAMARDVRSAARREGYASVSEYMRALVRERRHAELARGLAEERKEFEWGKGKKLTSLRSLR